MQKKKPLPAAVAKAIEAPAEPKAPIERPSDQAANEALQFMAKLCDMGIKSLDSPVKELTAQAAANACRVLALKIRPEAANGDQ